MSEETPENHLGNQVRNIETWNRTRQVPMENDIRHRRWRWIGHTLKKDNNPQGSRKRGRSRETWRIICADDEVERSGKHWNGVKKMKMAKDRAGW